MDITRGLNLDNNNEAVGNGQWIRARNILYKKGFKHPKNENSFTKQEDLEFTIIGEIDTNNEIYLFSQGVGGSTEFVTGLTDYFKIERINKNNVRETILRTEYITYNTGYPISGTYKYDSNNNIILAWCNGVDSDSETVYIMKPDILPFVNGVDTNYELNTSTEITAMQMFPELSIPNITAVEQRTSAGGILGGAHWLYLSYILPYEDESNYIAISSVILGKDKIDHHVYSGATNVSTFTISTNDIEPGEESRTGLLVNFSNLDIKFTKFRLCVLHKINNQFSAENLGVFNINSASQDFYYYGQSGITMSYEDLLVDNFVFDKCKSLSNFNNTLIPSNIEEQIDLGYQKYANNIQVGFTQAAPINIYSSSKEYYSKKVFLPDEVYALYIRLIHKDGRRDRWCTIPGRAVKNFDVTGGGSLASERDLLSDINAISGTGAEGEGLTTNSPSAQDLLIDTNAKWYQVKDTSDTLSVGGASGDMGYWENENEFYNQNSIDTETWDVLGSGIGIRKSGYVATVPNYQALQNKKWNTTIIADDGKPSEVRHHKMPSMYGFGTSVPQMISLNFSDVKIPTDIEDKIQGFEFGYAVRTQKNITKLATSIVLREEYEAVGAGVTNCNSARFYDFGMLSLKPSSKATYIKGEVSWHRNGGGALAFSNDYSNSADIVYSAPMNQSTRVIDTYDYYASNNSATPDYDNSDREECLNYEMASELTGVSGLFTKFRTKISGANVDLADGEFYLAHAMIYRTDVFTEYTNQNVARMDTIHYTDGSNTYPIANQFGGDTCYGTHGFAAKDTTMADTVRFFKFIYFSAYNVRLRHKDPTKYWKDYTLLDTPYEGFYSTDYNSINNNKLGNIFNPVVLYNTIFPYRLLKSYKGNAETDKLTWCSFSVNSYYDIPNNKGEIWNTVAMGKSLVIETQYSRFIAGSKDRLMANNVTAYLSSGEVFDNTPEEIISDDKGYSGTTSKFGSVVTPMGLVTIDKTKGKIFIYDGKMTELSNKDVTNYLLEHMRTTGYLTSNIDNPYMGLGITTGYDEENNRLILAIRDYATATYSYINSITLASGIYTYEDIESSVEWDAEYTTLNGQNFTNLSVIKYQDNYYQAVTPLCTDCGLSTSLFGIEYNFTVGGADGCLLLILPFENVLSNNINNYSLSTDISITLSYSFENKIWVSHHDYYPAKIIDTIRGMYVIQNALLSGINNKASHLYQMNQIGNGKYMYNTSGVHTTFPSYLDIVFNAQPLVNKILHSLQWSTLVRNVDNVILYNKTINTIMVYTDTQCSDTLPVDINNMDWWYGNNARGKYKHWNFDAFRDAVTTLNAEIIDEAGNPTAIVDITTKDWWDKNLFINTFFIVRLQIDNDVYDTTKVDDIYITSIGLRAIEKK